MRALPPKMSGKRCTPLTYDERLAGCVCIVVQHGFAGLPESGVPGEERGAAHSGNTRLHGNTAAGTAAHVPGNR